MYLSWFVHVSMPMNVQKILYYRIGYQIRRMGFTRGNFKPKTASSILQALFCRFCWLQLSNLSKLMISKKWKSRIASLVHNASGLSPNGLSRQKPARFALPQMRPTLFGEVPVGIFELNETQKNPES